MCRERERDRETERKRDREGRRERHTNTVGSVGSIGWYRLVSLVRFPRVSGIGPLSLLLSRYLCWGRHERIKQQKGVRQLRRGGIEFECWAWACVCGRAYYVCEYARRSMVCAQLWMHVCGWCVCVCVCVCV